MLDAIDTPAVLIDLDIAEANIDRFEAYCAAHGLASRPHIKTHKLPRLALRQIAAGAVGITCQKISEAEAMIAPGGIDDVLITYNIVGAAKLARLRALAGRVRLADARVIIVHPVRAAVLRLVGPVTRRCAARCRAPLQIAGQHGHAVG